MDFEHVEYADHIETSGSLADHVDSKTLTSEKADAVLKSIPTANYGSSSEDTGSLSHWLSLPVRKPKSRCLVSDEDAFRVDVNSFRSLCDYQIRSENRDHVFAVGGNDTINQTIDKTTDGTANITVIPSGSKELTLAGKDALMGSFLSRNVSPSPTATPTHLLQGFFTLPLNATVSTMAGARIRPFRSANVSLSPCIDPDLSRNVYHYENAESEHNSRYSPGTQNDQNAQNSQTSQYSDNFTPSPNPCHELPSGPHEPPHPTETYRSPRKAAPAIFHDQFTQFMEDRMVMFRPTSSQNNVEQLLSMNHPYQQADEVETLHLRNWFTLNQTRNNGQRCSSQQEVVHNSSPQSPASPLPVNDSTSSFLPRGVQGIGSLEPDNSAMVYTPRAVPLSEVKRPPVSPVQSQCMCLWWPFR